jgi:hypothetical protein
MPWCAAQPAPGSCRRTHRQRCGDRPAHGGHPAAIVSDRRLGAAADTPAGFLAGRHDSAAPGGQLTVSLRTWQMSVPNMGCRPGNPAPDFNLCFHMLARLRRAPFMCLPLLTVALRHLGAAWPSRPRSSPACKERQTRPGCQCMCQWQPIQKVWRTVCCNPFGLISNLHSPWSEPCYPLQCGLDVVSCSRQSDISRITMMHLQVLAR